jgi:hypothetical protein
MRSVALRARTGAALVAVLGLTVLTAALAATAQPAAASSFLKIGIYDEAQTLYGPVEKTYPALKALHVQVIRLNLYWGGRFGVARSRPTVSANPADPAYDWDLYDRTVDYAQQYGMQVVFSIYGTPSWANGGKGANVAPKNAADLKAFAYAAARRYSGTYEGPDGRLLPAVRMWLAWNEPNNPIFLTPQYKKVSGKWVIQSAKDYARICNAIYDGVHRTLIASEKVACGVTGPRGNNGPTTARPSVSPLAFLRAMKKAGAKRFDAYAHHPYYGNPSETPTTKPKTSNGAAPTAITLANINLLIAELTRLYGNKRVWLTEYGYQTRPPDPIYGVSYAKQALYLKQAFAIARANKRIDLMLWFLLRDEPTLAGWQSGLYTVNWQKKPAFNAFASLRH